MQASDLGAGLALCTFILSRTNGPVLWISAHTEGVWAPGLHALGLRADRLLQASYRKPADGLWMMEEALRSLALGGAVLEMDRLDMTASRRLQLAAEGSLRVGLLLRNVAEHGPSSAVSRWRVASLANAAARPRWRLNLLRYRAGRPGSWDVRWDGGALGVEEAALAEYA